MKKFLLALVLAGLAVAAPSLHAQDIDRSTTVNLGLRAYFQNPTVTNPPNLRFTVSKPAFTSLHLLGLIANALGTNFPTGAKLVMVNYATFQVQTADGFVLQNLSPDLISAQTRYDPTDPNNPYPESSTYNAVTERDVRQNYFVLRIFFYDGPANEFTLRGFTTENYSRSAKGVNNVRIVRDSFLMSASGDGYLGGRGVVFNGTVSGSGRRTEVEF